LSARAPLLLFSLILLACAPKIQADVTLSPELKGGGPKIYVLLPFEHRAPQREQERHPEAPAVVADAFETAFLETGQRLVERTRLEAILREGAFSGSGLTQDDAVKLGKLLSADVILFGAVTAYHDRGVFDQQPTKVGISVKAISVESGAILWKGSCTYAAPDMSVKKFTPTDLALPASKRLIEEYLKKQGA
jgi:hypothetical protein